jgi:hypothetical protein
VAEYQVATLKAMGSNAWRTAHNPVAPELLQYADQSGSRFDRNLHSRIPLVATPLLGLKLLHACDQWHSSRVFIAAYRLALNIRPAHDRFGLLFEWESI